MSEARTHFDVFDLPRRHALDVSELERRYRELSRHWHPDRFSRAPAAERAAVLARATDLNEAYRVLKSPTRRAEYLLKLAGIDVNDESAGNKLALDPAFLGEILELREELAEARAAGDAGRVRALAAQVQKQQEAAQEALRDGFARLEAGDRGVLAPLTQTVLSLRYHQRFSDEIAAYEEAALAASGA